MSSAGDIWGGWSTGTDVVIKVGIVAARGFNGNGRECEPLLDDEFEKE
jgi:hypothetical protein